MNWFLLSKHFVALVHKFDGPSKHGSGDINVSFKPEGVEVSLGTYDIPSLPSNLDLGIFPDEKAAMDAVSEKLEYIDGLAKNPSHDDEEE